MTVVVAAAQFTAGTDKDANFKQLRELVVEAAHRGAQLVVAPEYAMLTPPDPAADVSGEAEGLDGPYATAIAGLARETGVAIVTGMTERLPGERRISNTLLAVDDEGRRLGVYRKLHLYDAFGYHESLHVRPGEHAAPLVFGIGGLRFGAMTCYDLRFPEMARVLVDAGANVIVLPAAWVVGPSKEDHWATLVRARAIENTAYVIAAGQTGPRYTGHSLVVDPMGVVVAGAGEEPGLVTARLSTERLATVRTKLPSLAHRRFRVTAGYEGAASHA